MTKASLFKQLLTTKQVEFVMGAHNALSARIAEEAGFKAIWAGGLAISAAMGVRDCNELSWTQVVETVEFMSDATSIPILLDADTGYGNYNNVRLLIRKLENRGIASVCIEDKLFPKSNSFLDPEFQELADPDEFCGRIRAAKDAQTDPDFTVIARVEAFIAGLGLKEALKRAEAYREAGADGILIHSKSSVVDEIESFMQHWKDRCPVLVVPTSYYQTPTALLENLGVSMVIWSNHMLRASIDAMQRLAQQVQRDRSVGKAESDIAPLREVFRLQRLPELNRANQKYLPRKRLMKGYIVDVVNSAGQHTGRKPGLVDTIDLDTPVKCTAEEALRCVGISKVVPLSLNLTDDFSPRPADGAAERCTAILQQLVNQLEGPAIVVSSNSVFDTGVLGMLRDIPGDIVVVANTREDIPPSENTALPRRPKLVSRNLESHANFPCSTQGKQSEPEFPGLIKLTGEGVRHLKRVVARGSGSAMPAWQLLQAACRDGASVRVLKMNGSPSSLSQMFCAAAGD